MGLEVCILVGSIRKDSHSLRIAGLLSSILSSGGHQPTVIDPRMVQLAIPYHPEDEGEAAVLAAELQGRVRKADRIIFITPEYDGSYSAVTKILIELLGYPSAMAGKAVSVIGVATGRIGAYRAIEHLRSVLLHIGAYLCPSLLSLAEVHRSAGGEELSDLESQLRKHVDELLAFNLGTSTST